ncbi:hypothetical protein DYB32_006999 [Aphanomyces invadans]|uniref:Uncharacterized protein n=1 Tax=Aphanomyces invadans TaxID=157072 RepID=A0A3R6V7R3_9STRA|nr:hypothetical protein DYB32_006999 [Aphanomyces invadans]
MVGLNLFARATSRSRTANAGSENQMLAEEPSFSKSVTSSNKRLDSVSDDDSENPLHNKRQKTAATTNLMSAFSSNLLKKITFNKSRIVERYPDGCYVATKYGTAIVLQYREAERMYVLRMVYNAVSFFHASAVVREIKCMVGDRVKTKWDEDKYSIALDWRWDDDHVWRMKATTKMFDIPTPASATLASRATAARELVSKTIGDSYSSTAQRMSSVSSWRPSHSSYASLMRLNASSASTAKAVPVWSPVFGEGRLEAIADSQVAQIRFLRCGAVGYLQPRTYTPLDFATGDRIATVYGVGHVVAVLMSSGHSGPVYHIQLSLHNSMLYTVNPSSILAKKVSAASLPSSSYSFKLPSYSSTLPKFHLPSMPQGAVPSVLSGASSKRTEKYMVGDVLRSPTFGLVTITAIGPSNASDDDVVTCSLDNFGLHTATAVSSAKLYVALSQMEATFPDGVIPARRTLTSLYEKTKQAVYTSSTMLSSANGVLKAQAMSVKSTLEDLAAFKKGPKFAIDQRVLCPLFGSGFVMGIRDDGVYIVGLRKLRITAYFAEDVLKPFPYDRATHVIIGDRSLPVPMEVYQATNKMSRSAIIRESIAAQAHVRATLRK